MGLKLGKNMTFFQKNIIIALFSVSFVLAQDGPMTPPRQQLSRFYGPSSSTESSPESIRSNMSGMYSGPSSPLTPSGASSSMQSPGSVNRQFAVFTTSSPSSATRRTASARDRDENEEYTLAGTQRTLFDSPSKRVKAIPTVESCKSLDDLKGRYARLKESLGIRNAVDSYDLSPYNDAEIQELEKIRNVANARGWDSTFLALPLFRFSHLLEPDATGGYHLESGNIQVTPILENSKTKVYGRFFSFNKGQTVPDKTKQMKFSSFFPKDSPMETVTQAVAQAYRHVIAREDNKILGQSDLGMIEMTMDSNGLVATSAYPIVAYFDLTDSSSDLTALKRHVFSKKKLVLLAKHSRDSVTYELPGAEIIDIAKLVTRSDNARSVYVKVATADLQ